MEKKIHELLEEKKLFPVQNVKSGKKKVVHGKNAGRADRKNDGKEKDPSQRRERPEKQ